MFCGGGGRLIPRPTQKRQPRTPASFSKSRSLVPWQNLDLTMRLSYAKMMLPTKAKEHFQRQHKADKGESIRPTLTKWVLFSFSAPFSPIPAIIYQWAKRSKSEQVPKEFAHINPPRIDYEQKQSKVEAVRLSINHSRASLLFSPPARAKAKDF